MGVGTHTAGHVRPLRAGQTRGDLLRAVDRRVTVTQWVAHAIGCLDVVLLLFYVLPDPASGVSITDHIAPNAIAIGIYLPLAAVAGTIIGRRISPVGMAWIREDRDPTPQERRAALLHPNKCFKMDAGLWLGGVVLFLVVNATIDWHLALHTAWTALLGGITTCAIAHLLLERELRPVTDIALAAGPPSQPIWPGIKGRIILAWLLATGGGLLGLITVGAVGLIRDVPAEDIARSTLVLAGGSFVVGAGVMFATARGLARPLTEVRDALARVQAGDLTAETHVCDSSEVGMLQSGFNSMVEGLRERERVTDLYARQVGEDVAREALAAEPRLGGEVREVAVLFVDIIGSTTMATDIAPERVVARLNRFFQVVVEVTAEHGGWVNKFEGDAALCVFGAPVATEDPAGSALAAGRALQLRIARDVPGLEAGVGLSAGPAVAGWVGALQRFEYTVIGDPVNVASRLCELAKGRPDRLLASEAIVQRAAQAERARWRAGQSEVLRGRSTPTRLMSLA